MTWRSRLNTRRLGKSSGSISAVDDGNGTVQKEGMLRLSRKAENEDTILTYGEVARLAGLEQDDETGEWYVPYRDDDEERMKAMVSAYGEAY